MALVHDAVSTDAAGLVAVLRLAVDVGLAVVLGVVAVDVLAVDHPLVSDSVAGQVGPKYRTLGVVEEAAEVRATAVTFFVAQLLEFAVDALLASSALLVDYQLQAIHADFVLVRECSADRMTCRSGVPFVAQGLELLSSQEERSSCSRQYLD